MAYKEETISTIVKRLNVNHFLPAIQREYVWSQEQICTLFDSIMRGYPISSFLFWELEDQNRAKWDVYKFIDSFKQGGTHNEPANTNGVANLTLVLDGQQRLTSLLIGLKGSYSSRAKYKRKAKAQSWTKQTLYIDLFKDPKIVEEDGETGRRYKLAFRTDDKSTDGSHYWYEVGKILNIENDEALFETRDQLKEGLPGNTTKGQMILLERNLETLHRAVWKDNSISFFCEREQDYDKALDIFVRANVGGTKLSKSDLLLSMMTSKWGDVNAREEIYGFVDRLNKDLSRKNDFDKDIVMKSCLVLCDLPVKYQVENFNKANLELIFGKWDNIKNALERTVVLTNSFGIDRDTLTSANALIPIAYYFLKSPGLNLLGTSAFDSDNRSAVRKWLLLVLLNNVFGGQSDSLLTDLRAVVNAATLNDFPTKELTAQISKSGGKAQFDDAAIDSFLEYRYGDRDIFLPLSLLYDEHGWGNTTYHMDHIFPQSAFDRKSLSKSGLDADAVKEYIEMSNSIANLQLLTEQENLEKSGKKFDQWITSRATDYKTKHLIPDDAGLYNMQNFPKFIEEREALITKRLKGIFGGN
jgi:uncharacterized protein with ParB-like and HNH nuclease domain